MIRSINRAGDRPDIQFTFPGYTFRPRKALDKYGRVYLNFSPAVSRDALKDMRQTIGGRHLQLKSEKTMADLSAMFAPNAQGSRAGSNIMALPRIGAQTGVAEHEPVPDPGLMRKHKRLAGHKTPATEMLKRLAQSEPSMFIHWSMGYLS